MHCIWNLFSLILLCVGDEGSPRFGDGAEYPSLVPCVLRKNPQTQWPISCNWLWIYAFLVKSLFLDTEALSESCMCMPKRVLHLFERKMNDDSWFLSSHFPEPKSNRKTNCKLCTHWNCQCDKHSSGGKHVTMFRLLDLL
jgi:hypothetical protein